MSFPFLSSMILVPFITGLLLLVFYAGKDNYCSTTIKNIGLVATIINMVIGIFAAHQFLSNANVFSVEDGYQLFAFTENFGFASPVLAADGLSISLILLTAILMPICILASNKITYRTTLYVAAFLMLESIVIGVFSAMNALLFYILFEASLIPMFMIIGIWGGENRIYAAMKFFLYTFLGSVLFLVAIIYMNSKLATFDIIKFQLLSPSFELDVQKLLWLAFFASFAVKIPMFPVHTWLPDAHVQAPTAGSVILAGVLLKLGGYGFLRFSIPMLPEASVYFTDFMCVLSLIAIVYASIVAFAQKDMKKMIAYSSIAHMGYVTLGMFVGLKYGKSTNIMMNFDGINMPAVASASYYGSIFQMISHGFVSAALFLVVGSLYERLHTKEIAKYGGVASKMPVLALFFMIFTLSSVGLPGTSGFIGEFLVMMGTIFFNKTFGILATLGVVLGAIYMLVLYAKIMFGEIKNSEITKFSDVSIIEKAYYLPLAIITLLIGVYPNIVNVFINKSVLGYTKLFFVE